VMRVPRVHNKSRRPKSIPLTAREALVLKEQLLARTAGTSLVFPNDKAASGIGIAFATKCGNRPSKPRGTTRCRFTCSGTRPFRSCAERGIGPSGCRTRRSRRWGCAHPHALPTPVSE
jgi:hypothetical protein